MNDPIVWEPLIRVAAFSIVIAVLGTGESRAPRRARRRLSETLPNIGLFATDTLVLRLVSVTSLAGVAALTNAEGWGLLHAMHAPAWLETTVTVVVLDLCVYLQHRALHWVPWFWRLHAVHHCDVEFDVTTGIRFHLGEALLSFAIKLGVVVVLGASVWAVIIFEALLSAASLFTHANWRLPSGVDKALRLVLVTPDMHRVHHSVAEDEHNRNFGFLLSWWDRWFDTYREQPREGHEVMPVGLSVYRAPGERTFWALLRQPFAPYPASQ